MACDGSAIRALLDGAVAKGAVHGIAALVAGLGLCRLRLLRHDPGLWALRGGLAQRRRWRAETDHGADGAAQPSRRPQAARGDEVDDAGVLERHSREAGAAPVIETLMGFEKAVYRQVGAAVPA